MSTKLAAWSAPSGWLASGPAPRGDVPAEVMSNTRLEELLAGQPADVKAEIIEINTDARPRALQVALLVPLLAGLIGLINAFRMVHLPEARP